MPASAVVAPIRTLAGLTGDVSIGTPVSGALLVYNGSRWVNVAIAVAALDSATGNATLGTASFSGGSNEFPVQISSNNATATAYRAVNSTSGSVMVFGPLGSGASGNGIIQLTAGKTLLFSQAGADLPDLAMSGGSLILNTPNITGNGLDVQGGTTALDADFIITDGAGNASFYGSVAVMDANSPFTGGTHIKAPAGGNFFTLTLPSALPGSTQALVCSNTGLLSFQTLTSGTVTSVALSGGTTGLTASGGPITGSGTLTLAGTLNVGGGGSGTTTLTNHGILLGSGTAHLGSTSAGTSGQLLLGQGTSADPNFQTLSGDATITNAGVLTITKAAVIPGGSGTELQYRAGSSSFGAVAGSGTDTLGNVTFGGVLQVNGNFAPQATIYYPGTTSPFMTASVLEIYYGNGNKLVSQIGLGGPYRLRYPSNDFLGDDSANLYVTVGGLKDSGNTFGTLGQFLSSTGTQVAWGSPSFTLSSGTTTLNASSLTFTSNGSLTETLTGSAGNDSLALVINLANPNTWTAGQTFQGNATLGSSTAGGSLLGGSSSIPMKFGPYYGDITTDADAATITFNVATTKRHQVTLAGSRVLAVSNDQNGQDFQLILGQDSIGSRTVTWWSGISWQGGTVPTLTTTANKKDVFSFLRLSAGSYLGQSALNF